MSGKVSISESGNLIDKTEFENPVEVSKEEGEVVSFVEANYDDIMSVLLGVADELSEASITNMTVEDADSTTAMQIETETGTKFLVGVIEDENAADRMWVAVQTYNFRAFDNRVQSYDSSSYVVADNDEDAIKKIERRFVFKRMKESESFEEGGPGSGNHAPGQGYGKGKPGSGGKSSSKSGFDASGNKRLATGKKSSLRQHKDGSYIVDFNDSKPGIRLRGTKDKKAAKAMHKAVEDGKITQSDLDKGDYDVYADGSIAIEASWSNPGSKRRKATISGDGKSMVVKDLSSGDEVKYEFENYDKSKEAAIEMVVKGKAGAKYKGNIK